MAPTATTPKSATKAKSANGVKKAGPGRPPGKGKKSNTKTAMVKMQAFFKAHRHEYKDLAFKDQQKELGKKWKTSKENPKVSGA